MDRGKKPSNLFGKNSKIYMDLKDIVRENALPFLPAKSLRRCRGVCRDWKLTISTPFFAHNQSNSFNHVSGFFVQTAPGVPSFVSLDPTVYGVPDPSLSFLPEPVDIRSSSNGLLCCQGRTGYRAYYICNPVTKQWRKLPKPEADHGTDPVVVLIFEPSLLNFIAEYKLICAFPSELDGIEFEIFSSENGSWRISADICFGEASLIPTSGVYVNGTVYWLSSRGLLALDLTTERSKILYHGPGTLGVMNKKLCAAYLHGNQRLNVSLLSNTHSNTMQMHSQAKTWVSLKPSINPNLPVPVATNNCYAGEYDYYTPIRSEVRDGVLFVDGDVVLIRAGGTLYSYDMKKKTTATLGEVDSRARIFGYVNSLVELNTSS
ncbi:hypothetical protein SLEP1_g8026 [Rubroshorea leprosula]|uniref:F-box associated beta-propeller type 1 domain-containing protein n=1 Tax=Rubroshorea leprosula TaxID=152421 RepID=A0AAV5I9K5_9ROSI|nr:hypothetical protein SLEP1_g8026 [Rubroshorea leprosula]